MMGVVVDAWVRRPDAELACWVRGDGPPIGYAHGMLLSSAAEDARGLYDWTPVTEKRRLIRYDARAHGRSTGRPVVDDYMWPRLADDLLAVADAVTPAAEPMDWCGASMGCGALLWAATRAPNRFRRLVLLIPPTTGTTRVAAARMYAADADTVERVGAGALPRSVPPIFAHLPSYPQKIDVRDELLPSLLRGAARSDLPDAGALAGLPHPTLVLAWESDPVHPVSTARYLADTLPRASLHVSATEADVRTWPERIVTFVTG